MGEGSVGLLTRNDDGGLSRAVLHGQGVVRNTAENGLVGWSHWGEGDGGVPGQHLAVVEPADGAGGIAVGHTLQGCDGPSQGRQLLTDWTLLGFNNLHLEGSDWRT